MARRLALTLNADDLTADDLASFARQASGEAFGRQPLAFQLIDDDGRPIAIKGRAVLMTGVLGLTATTIPTVQPRATRNGTRRTTPAPEPATDTTQEATQEAPQEAQGQAPDIAGQLDEVKAKGRQRAPRKPAQAMPAATFTEATPKLIPGRTGKVGRPPKV